MSISLLFNLLIQNKVSKDLLNWKVTKWDSSF